MRSQLVAAVLLAALPATAWSQSLIAQDASMRDVDFDTAERSFAVVEADGTNSSSAWRVVERTGNGNENHIVTDGAGRLYDFGGNYINVSEDSGLSWRQVTPGQRVWAGEGTLVAAPGGDMVGVVWDVYGDTLMALKFEAATAKWRYAPMPVHSPFYDRQWIGVVPGPVTIDGQTAPWVSFVKGGTTKEEWLYSIDGLTYTGLSNKPLGAVANGTVQAPLPTTPSADLDFVHAHGGMGLTPLGAGRALANPDFLYMFAASTQPAGYALLDPQQQVPWSGYELPGESPAGQFRVDSRGWIHNVVVDGDAERRAFEYRLSEDGGRTFRSARVALPGGMRIVGDWDIDARVNGALGVAAVAVHGDRGGDNPDGDLLYKLDVRGPQPALLRSYAMGLGDSPTNSVTAGSPRFDFASLAMFPDGRVAMSFLDSQTRAEIAGETWVDPELAVELGDPLPRGFADSATPALGPLSPSPDPPAHGAPKPVDPTGSSSLPHRLRVKARRNGRRVVIAGVVLPRHPGHDVRIQRHTGRRWVTVQRTRASKRSAFRVSLPARGRMSLRALAVADAAGHRSGRSRAVVVR